MSTEFDGVHEYPVSAPRVADPVKRRSIATIAANSRWAHESDRRAATQPMRDALERKFEDEVDPDRVLDPVERAKRASNARKAHYARVSAKAAATRAARKAAREAASKKSA